MGDSIVGDAGVTVEQKLYLRNALHVVGEWSVHDDGDGRIFYYNRKADSSRWKVPDDLAALETEFMMKLMLQNAVARSNVWTAHDAGNGTLYYFNSKTRQSVWERPSEWGEAEVNVEIEAEEKVQEERQEKKAAKVENGVEKKRYHHRKHNKEPDKAPEEKQLEKEVRPLTEEELGEEEERKVREHKQIEQFRAMLRDRNIMPLCKWSVALPQIARDPRFMGVPTMDERRAIFENFVTHRRDDMKVEKKSKLKQARKLFAELLSEQFQLDTWEPRTTLSIFLSTLETHIDAERYKQIQENALALLTLSAQENIYSKKVADYNSEALKRDGEQLRLMKFLENKIVTLYKTTMPWESEEVQNLVRDFYSDAVLSGGSPALLSNDQQKKVFEALVARNCGSARNETECLLLHSSPKDRAHSIEHKHRESILRRESRHSRYNLGRSRRFYSRSVSRSRSRERDRSHRSRRSIQRRSASLSRSRSRKKHSSRKRYRRRQHSYSPSRSRSRTRS